MTLSVDLGWATANDGVLSLHERGIPCTVFEAAQEARDLGVDINILPHAIRELDALGLLPMLDTAAVRTRALRYLNRLGQTIWVEKRGLHAGHDMPQQSIHRGRLHDVLWRAVLARLGAEALRTGRRFVALEQDGEGVVAGFTDGSVARGDALVGRTGFTPPCVPCRTQTRAACAGTTFRCGATHRSGQPSGAVTR